MHSIIKFNECMQLIGISINTKTLWKVFQEECVSIHKKYGCIPSIVLSN